MAVAALRDSTPEAIGKLLEAGQGFDVPPFEKLDSPVWANAEPPKGTLYNFPPRGEVIVVLDEGKPEEHKFVLPYKLFDEKQTVTVARIQVGRGTAVAKGDK